MLKKSFRIFAIPLFKDNYSYIVQTSSKEPLLLVDPANPAVIINCLEKYFSDQNVGHILYTHKHWDHAGGSEDLYKLLVTKQEKLQVYSGIQDADHIKTVNQPIRADQQLDIGQAKIRAYKVPCHTRGHVIYHIMQTNKGFQNKRSQKNLMQTLQGKKIKLFEENQCAFTGDTLFSAGIGKFFQGNQNQMFANLKHINQKLNPTCSIFCGHQYTLQNLKWATTVQPQNQAILKFISQLQAENSAQICTLPTSLKRQSQINLFFRAVINKQNKLGVSSLDYLRILRAAKNNNSNKLEHFK